VKKVEFKEGKWQFDQAMQNADWDPEIFDWMVGETEKMLDAAEKNEFWKQYNEWARLADYHHSDHSSPKTPLEEHEKNIERFLAPFSNRKQMIEELKKSAKDQLSRIETDLKIEGLPQDQIKTLRDLKEFTLLDLEALKAISKEDPPTTSPSEVFLVDGLSLKDYYDLRDLRLLLMGLEKELIGKYGIIEAEPLASKVRDLIKEKITQVTNKIGASPEHHSNSDPGKYVVRFNEGTDKQEDIEIEAQSPEGATIEASRTFFTEHGVYPTTAKIISPRPTPMEKWQRRALGEERPPF
jgi:hypothetical protein